ncbi:hypothetical protein ACLMJK_007469 [Lecanora helva]
MPVAWIIQYDGGVSIDRRAFKLKFPDSDDHLYEARVDGITTDGKGGVRSFMEVKAALRVDRQDVRVQESAQMAAFINNDTNPLSEGQSRKKWMISMGGYQGYITIATYDHDYVKYLSGHSKSKSFMDMHEYGPFDLRRLGEMKLFLENIGTFMRYREA